MNMSDIILKELKCIKCGLYLSCAPIKITVSGENICGRCCVEQTEEVFIHNKVYEHIATTMKFPCRFNSYGCDYFPKWGRVDKHEKMCDFRQYQCPLKGFGKCSWIGTRSQLYDHCSKNHEESTTSLNSLTVVHNLTEDDDKTILMGVFGVIFLFQIKISATLDKIWHCMRYIGNPKCINQYYCTLKIWKQSTTLTDIVPILRFEENSSFLELQTLEHQITGLQTVLKGSQKICFQLSVNKKLDLDLLQEIKCLVCRSYCKPKIFSLDERAVCRQCAPSNCVEDPDLSSLGNQLLYPCHHRQKSCPYYDNVKGIWKHEIFSCKFFFCFVCLKEFDCPMETHFYSKHSIMIQTFEEILHLSLSYSVNWLLVTNSENTIVCRYSYDDVYLNLLLCTNLTNEELCASTCAVKIFDFETKKTVIKNMEQVVNHAFDFTINLPVNEIYPFVENNNVSLQFELFKTVSA